jgi:Ferritin-like domain
MRHRDSGRYPPGEPSDRRRVSSRSSFLRRAAVVAATIGAGSLATTSRSAASIGHDVQILNYVLRLESLQAAFYSQAITDGALSGELHQLARVLARQERAHVAFLRRRLGNLAPPERTYDFGEATADDAAFADTAHRLEEAAVAAYIGEGPNLGRSLMVPFAQMCSVEARHAAWIADVLRADPAPRPADRAKSPAEILSLIREMGFESASS